MISGWLVLGGVLIFDLLDWFVLVLGASASLGPF